MAIDRLMLEASLDMAGAGPIETGIAITRDVPLTIGDEVPSEVAS
jgi:hypothetical protein